MVFEGYCVCWMLLIIISLRFVKHFVAKDSIALLVLLSNWSISFLPSVRYVTSPARAKSDHDIDRFCFIEMAIEHVIWSYWNSVWFERLYQLSIAIGMVDPQDASTKRLHFCCCCCWSLICKNGLSVKC